MIRGRTILTACLGAVVGAAIALLAAPHSLPSGTDLEEASRGFVDPDWTVDEFISGRSSTVIPFPFEARQPYRVIIRTSTGQDAEPAIAFVEAQATGRGWNLVASSSESPGAHIFEYERGAVDAEVSVFKTGDRLRVRAVSDPQTVRTRHILFTAVGAVSAGALLPGALTRRRRLRPPPAPSPQLESNAGE